MFSENPILTIFLLSSTLLALICSSIAYSKTDEDKRTNSRKAALSFVVIFMVLSLGAVILERVKVPVPLGTCASWWNALAVLSAVCTYHVYDGVSSASGGDKTLLSLVVLTMIVHMLLLVATSCKIGGPSDVDINVLSDISITPSEFMRTLPVNYSLFKK